MSIENSIFTFSDPNETEEETGDDAKSTKTADDNKK